METKDLITAYAYSNLQRAILTTILADTIRASDDPAEMLQQYYGSTREHLRRADFPPGDENSEPVRLEALNLTQRFFRDVEELLVRWGTLSERKLIL